MRVFLYYGVVRSLTTTSKVVVVTNIAFLVDIIRQLDAPQNEKRGNWKIWVGWMFLVINRNVRDYGGVQKWI